MDSLFQKIMNFYCLNKETNNQFRQIKTEEIIQKGLSSKKHERMDNLIKTMIYNRKKEKHIINLFLKLVLIFILTSPIQPIFSISMKILYDQDFYPIINFQNFNNTPPSKIYVGEEDINNHFECNYQNNYLLIKPKNFFDESLKIKLVWKTEGKQKETI